MAVRHGIGRLLVLRCARNLAPLSVVLDEREQIHGGAVADESSGHVPLNGELQGSVTRSRSTPDEPDVAECRALVAPIRHLRPSSAARIRRRVWSLRARQRATQQLDVDVAPLADPGRMRLGKHVHHVGVRDRAQVLELIAKGHLVPPSVRDDRLQRPLGARVRQVRSMLSKRVTPTGPACAARGPKRGRPCPASGDAPELHGFRRNRVRRLRARISTAPTRASPAMVEA